MTKAAGIVRLQAELVAVTAGDADRRGRRQDARAGDVAGVDRVAQRDLEVPEGTGAARGRHAGAERGGRVTGGGEHDVDVRPLEDGPDRTLGRIQRVVGMGVDEPGQECPAGAVDPGRGRAGGVLGVGSRRIVGFDRADPVAVHGHVDMLAGGLGQAVDEPDVTDLDAHR